MRGKVTGASIEEAGVDTNMKTPTASGRGFWVLLIRFGLLAAAARFGNFRTPSITTSALSSKK